MTRMPKLIKDEIVCVVWKDTYSDPTWIQEENCSKVHSEECKTLGFFYAIENGDLKLSQNWGKRQDGGRIDRDLQCIPIGCIIRVVKLRLK